MKREEEARGSSVELNEEALDGVTGGSVGTMQYQQGMRMTAETAQYQPGMNLAGATPLPFSADSMNAQTLPNVGNRPASGAKPASARKAPGGGSHSI